MLVDPVKCLYIQIVEFEKVNALPQSTNADPEKLEKVRPLH